MLYLAVVCKFTPKCGCHFGALMVGQHGDNNSELTAITINSGATVNKREEAIESSLFEKDPSPT